MFTLLYSIRQCNGKVEQGLFRMIVPACAKHNALSNEHGIGLRVEDELFDYMYAPNTASQGRK